jgi:hypothetical protein
MTTTKGTEMKTYRGIQIKRAEIGFGLGYAVALRIDNNEVRHTSGSLATIKARIDFSLDTMNAVISDDTLIFTAEQVMQHAFGDFIEIGWFTAPVRIIDRDTYIAEQKAKHEAALSAGGIVVGQTVKVQTWRKSKKHLQGVIGTVVSVSQSPSYSGLEAKIKTRSGETHRVIVEELVAVKAGA